MPDKIAVQYPEIHKKNRLELDGINSTHYPPAMVLSIIIAVIKTKCYINIINFTSRLK
jgi:hypothetical protein